MLQWRSLVYMNLSAFSLNHSNIRVYKLHSSDSVSAWCVRPDVEASLSVAP